MKEFQEIKVGIVGCGGIAEDKHIPGHRSVKGVSIIAACDIEEARAKAFAKKNNIPYIFTDYMQLAAMDELDAVSVCTPNNFHAGPTIAALRAGKHVICEKPIAANAVDGQAMIEAQKASGKVLQIGLQSRFRPEARTLRKLFDEGFFGSVYYGRAVAMRRREVPVSPSFLSKTIAGGGSLIDLGVHSLDILLWMIGCPKPVEAFGMTAKKIGDNAEVVNPGGKWNPEEFEVEDFAMGTIRFENGLMVTLETAWASHITNIGGTFFIGDLAGATYEPLQIYFDKKDNIVNCKPKLLKDHTGGSIFDLIKVNLLMLKNCKPKLLKGVPSEFESFHTAIREGLPSPIPVEEVLNVVKIFDAVYESAKTGRSVSIM
jgi:predicted dehydrogenase